MTFSIAESLSGQAWRLREPPLGLAEAIAQRCGVPEVVGRVLAARRIPLEDAPRVLSPTLRDWLPDPALFRDMEAGAARVAAAIQADQAIVVFGDYDVDGATSAALLRRAFAACGAACVSTYIPDRLMEGYGPSGDALLALKQAGADLVITVDCGTQAFAALEAARSANLDVIVVDHHKASIELPAALAIINPNRFDEGDEGAAHGHVAAVGMAFLFAVAVVRTLRSQGRFTGARTEPKLLDLLDLVALGTVCDVVPLTGLNRAFVAQGLKVMAKRGNLGLATLADVAGVDSAPDAGTCGFHLGPRINAGGRVGRSDLGVRLLTTQDSGEARALAQELDRLNAERKAIEALVLEQAQAAADTEQSPVLTLAGEGWHPGVIGIVAGRIKERYGRPSLVIGINEGVGKGSGRSIPGVDLGAAVLAAKEAGLLVAGGGHAMAAGLTVDPYKIKDLRAFLNEALSAATSAARASAGLSLDALLAAGGVTPQLVKAIGGAGPFGAGFPAPRFAVGPVSIVKADLVGTDHVRIIAQGQDGARLKAVAFRAASTAMGTELLAARGRRFWLAGKLVVDSWGGEERAELHVEDAAIAA
jgi:single-stranded-DNA-specific exonuclease